MTATPFFEKRLVGETSKLLVKIVRQVKPHTVSHAAAETLEFGQPHGIVIG